MATVIHDPESLPIIDAAHAWVDKCLLRRWIHVCERTSLDKSEFAGVGISTLFSVPIQDLAASTRSLSCNWNPSQIKLSD
jgi:hypothetical protein